MLNPRVMMTDELEFHLDKKTFISAAKILPLQNLLN